MSVFAEPSVATEPLHCPIKLTGIVPEKTVYINRSPPKSELIIKTDYNWYNIIIIIIADNIDHMQSIDSNIRATIPMQNINQKPLWKTNKEMDTYMSNPSNS